MLKKRLIPKLLLTKKMIGSEEIDILVTTINYKKRISIGDPLSQAKIYEANLADELIITAIDCKSLGDNDSIFQLLKRMSEEIFMPICVGGGVRRLQDIENLLKAGADKVSINSKLLNDKNFATDASKCFGSQCVVASIDYGVKDSNCYVFDHNHSRLTSTCLFEFIKEITDSGVGEIHLCNIDKDGTSLGLDVKTSKKINDNLDIPLIISGGVGTAQDFIEGFNFADVSAIASGTYFCSKDQNPMQARSHIANAKIPIRMGT